ncbi:MAG: conserved hypothetical protein [Candidatus Desulfovibrio kirbyi]|uniref:Uncharacterized protein n=1 Tax=Candidatus Desulfovibrio kirbyi TaxID=2696086 RepID=A0A6L2R410_9BACT|nr:MAG: conserved hypothetical protein [Candidatus Desulfovibrio kirbyi]
MSKWEEVFSKDGLPWQADASLSGHVGISTLEELKRFLDAVHIRQCLVRPYYETKNYPLVEARELLPSFDSDMFEHKSLPGFALVAFARQLEYFSEIFQFDKVYPPLTDDVDCPLENQAMEQNLLTLSSRLPRTHQEIFRRQFQCMDTAQMENYPLLMPYLLNMDRAHVLAWDTSSRFHLAGIFASFPSDVDTELKRFGMQIGKFVYGDSAMYVRNRIFVYQYLMELYGFPIVSERRTSSALFARKLQKMNEPFLLRVLGQTDRTLTTYTFSGNHNFYPMLEKIALVAVGEGQDESLETIRRDGYFLDESKRVVIIKITYHQHRFNQDNVHQDRALSVAAQELLHPLTGAVLSGLNIIKDTRNMFLHLTDIVQGEFFGRTVYKRTELVENTDTDEKRLKVLSSWLTKNQRRIICYSDEFFVKISKVLSGYLNDPEHTENFEALRNLRQEVLARFSYIQQARSVRILAELRRRTFKGARIGYRKALSESLNLLTELKFEIVNFFPDLVDIIIATLEKILQDRYLRRNYIDPPQASLTSAGAELRKNYGKLVALQDNFKAIRKARLGRETRNVSTARQDKQHG